MLSMTGYGKAEYTGEGISLTVEIKTVNNRNFDLNARVPRAFFALEDKVRKAVRSHIERGKADLYINFSDTRRAASGVNINEERAQAVFSAAKELALLLGAENDMTVSRHHARMDLGNIAAGYATIEDLGSLNGTWVDGAIATRATLKDGSTIQIGTFRMVFHTNARQRRIDTEA